MEIPLGTDRWGQTVIFRRQVSPLLSLLLSLFMHGSWLHLLGNMLFLWIFGNNVEDRLGRFKFIFFYLLCGVGASLVHVLFNLDSLTPVIGASGAVSGVMGAYLLLFPQARIRTLVFVFILVTTMDIPAAVFLVIWFAFQFFYAGGGAGIAWLAHVGGFILGMVLLMILRERASGRRSKFCRNDRAEEVVMKKQAVSSSRGAQSPGPLFPGRALGEPAVPVGTGGHRSADRQAGRRRGGSPGAPGFQRTWPPSWPRPGAISAACSRPPCF